MIKVLSVVVLGFIVGSSAMACSPEEANAVLKSYLNSPVLYSDPLTVKKISEKFNGAIDNGKFYLITAHTSRSGKDHKGYYPMADGNYDMFTYVTLNASTCGVRTAVQDECKSVTAAKYDDLVLVNEDAEEIVPAIKAICATR